MLRVDIKMLGRFTVKLHSPKKTKNTKQLRARISRGHLINHLKVIENSTEK